MNRRTRRGVLVCLVLALPSGLAATCAVAWHDMSRSIIRYPEDRTTSDQVARVTTEVYEDGPNRDQGSYALLYLTSPPPREVGDARLPGLDRLPYRNWREYVLRASQSAGQTFAVSFEAVGWPVKCFTGGYATPSFANGRALIGTIRYERNDRVHFSFAADPLWPELVLSTIFYALPCWALWMLAWAGWTRLRQRNPGLCEACGYDVAGMALRCPECGCEVPRPGGGR